jgi:repressor LexA
MMARKKQKGLNEKHKRVLDVLSFYTEQYGYPPSIREMCTRANISSTSVANYYLDRLEELGYIERDRQVARGIRVIKEYDDSGGVLEKVQEAATAAQQAVRELVSIPLVGQIVASEPVTSFSDQPSTMIDVARSLLTAQSTDDLFALTVSGDSMIDAMVNDGDIVIMRPPHDQVKNGEMVAVWLNDRDETTLKYFYLEDGRVRLQPANPTMDPIFIDDPSTVDIQGQVVMVVRQLDTMVA